MAYRTLNPWGHISRADRAARQELATRISLRARLTKEAEWPELERTLILITNMQQGRVTDEQRRRVNELIDALNTKGYTDAQIERAL